MQENSNIDSIGNGFFIVRSQAGFRKLLKKEGWTRGYLLVGSKYPDSYPAIVVISHTGPGDSWFKVNSIAIDSMCAACCGKS